MGIIFYGLQYLKCYDVTRLYKKVFVNSVGPNPKDVTIYYIVLSEFVLQPLEQFHTPIYLTTLLSRVLSRSPPYNDKSCFYLQRVALL